MSKTPDHLPHLQGIFSRLFDAHPAHVAMIDGDGTILAVNTAWRRFAEFNGMSGTAWEGISYTGVCQNAAESGDPSATEALVGLLDVINTGRPKFTMTYPCHAPHELRWFRLWIEPQFPDANVVIVAHELIRVEPVGGPDLTQFVPELRQ